MIPIGILFIDPFFGKVKIKPKLVQVTGLHLFNMKKEIIAKQKQTNKLSHAAQKLGFGRQRPKSYELFQGVKLDLTVFSMHAASGIRISSRCKVMLAVSEYVYQYGQRLWLSSLAGFVPHVAISIYY